MKWLVTRREEGESIPAGPAVSLVKVAGSSTAGRASVIQMRLDSGWDGPPLHVHDELDHIWLVEEGAVTVKLGEEAVDLQRGDIAWVSHGQPHSFATGTEPATMLQIDTPRALDSYFRDLAEAFPRGTHPDPEVVAEIMARHDTKAI